MSTPASFITSTAFGFTSFAGSVPADLMDGWTIRAKAARASAVVWARGRIACACSTSVSRRPPPEPTLPLPTPRSELDALALLQRLLGLFPLARPLFEMTRNQADSPAAKQPQQ